MSDRTAATTERPPSGGRPGAHLAHDISMTGLVFTALSAMVGVGINILPFAVQRSHPGVQAAVPYAYLVAAIPALLTALCYAVLSSAMPRAGGSYVYTTRALNPFLGFLASFAQWFGLSIAMGVVAYLFVPMVRDLMSTAGLPGAAAALDRGIFRVPLALAAIGLAWWINFVGVKTYERAIVVMLTATVVGPAIMIVTGLVTDPETLVRLAAERSSLPPPVELPDFSATAFLATCVTLFSSFIGFDAVAQAGGEARNSRDLPKAIVIAIAAVTLYYLVFTWSVYRAVPWSHMYREALVHDISAPGLLAPALPPWLAAVILAAVGIAILKVIPAVILANSRLLFAFGEDGVFPRSLTRVHPRYRTPHVSLAVTSLCAMGSVLGCEWAGDFFMGIDTFVLSMLVGFALTAAAVLTLPAVNAELHRRVTFLTSRASQVAVASGACLALTGLLLIQIVTDLRAPVPWYMHATPSWLLVMACGSLVFAVYWRRLVRAGVDPRAEIFSKLPEA